MQGYINTASTFRNLPGRPANMDSFRIPLARPSLPAETWRLALQSISVHLPAGEVSATLVMLDAFSAASNAMGR